MYVYITFCLSIFLVDRHCDSFHFWLWNNAAMDMGVPSLSLNVAQFGGLFKLLIKFYRKNTFEYHSIGDDS